MLMVRASKRFRGRGSNAGFTFLEVLVAAIILVIVMFGLLQFGFRGRKQVDFEEDRRKATAAAQGRLDQAHRWSFAYLEELESNGGSDTTLVVDGRPYSVSLDVFPGGNSHWKRVRAAVSWQAKPKYGGAAVTRSDTVTTHIGRVFGEAPS
jgi:type II secretory pathway pseudopilin PulG